jgi:hypothetical protein
MKNERKHMVFITIVAISVLGSTFGSAVAAATTFGEIKLTPPAPTALSSVSISLNISGDAPLAVNIIVQECNGGTGICYPDEQNVTMSETTTGHYEVSVTLKHSDATYITCIAYAKTTAGWIHSAEKKVNLSESPSDGNQTDGGSTNGKSPGFEIVVFVVATGICLLVLGRKRFR